MDNLNLAFDIAEKYLDIPRMLDAEGEDYNNLAMADRQTKNPDRRPECLTNEIFLGYKREKVVLYEPQSGSFQFNMGIQFVSRQTC